MSWRYSPFSLRAKVFSTYSLYLLSTFFRNDLGSVTVFKIVSKFSKCHRCCIFSFSGSFSSEVAGDFFWKLGYFIIFFIGKPFPILLIIPFPIFFDSGFCAICSLGIISVQPEIWHLLILYKGALTSFDLHQSAPYLLSPTGFEINGSHCLN